MLFVYLANNHSGYSFLCIAVTMPGPRMGPRPADFNEEEIRKSPTFRKWMDIPKGGKLRYACRDFIKGHEDDEERLMRRIMIARRNNVRDHEKLKRARTIASKKQQKRNQDDGKEESNSAKGADGSKNPKDESHTKPTAENTEQDSSAMTLAEPPPERKRRYSTVFSDAEVAREMDSPAVEATRSYRAWSKLSNGSKFQYNQTYIKGAEGHDWMLRKNIWRRMRYRRENKKMVEEVLPEETKPVDSRPPKKVRKIAVRTRGSRVSNSVDFYNNAMDPSVALNPGVSTASQIVDHALLSTTANVIAGIQAASIPNNIHHLQHHLHQISHERSLESTAAEAAASIPHDPDTDAVVEAAVAAGESYTSGPYVHNPLSTSVDGLGLALDAAARLAAAKAVTLETDEAILAAAAAGHAPPPLHHHPLEVDSQHGQQPPPLHQGSDTHDEEVEEALGRDVMEYFDSV
jgi:hypothetical protein